MIVAERLTRIDRLARSTFDLSAIATAFSYQLQYDPGDCIVN